MISNPADQAGVFSADTGKSLSDESLAELGHVRGFSVGLAWPDWRICGGGTRNLAWSARFGLCGHTAGRSPGFRRVWQRGRDGSTPGFRRGDGRSGGRRRPGCRTSGGTSPWRLRSPGPSSRRGCPSG
ncbi:hypothetical protein BV133_1860 [Blastochloris viridis]|uniref:Uncharacterized protein n=1 Tax=Blastochloris viridis TaxID=1079 RepID=A0A182D2N9_BLAVI|nr:hypothetical protein BV133_1860 [Blastochloris viridis]